MKGNSEFKNYKFKGTEAIIYLKKNNSRQREPQCASQGITEARKW